MKRSVRILSLALSLVMVLAVVAGCGKPQSEAGLNEPLKNKFFEYTVLSAAKVDSYGDYTPTKEGMTLLQTEVKVKNVFLEAIPMGDADFQIQWGEGDEDFAYSVDPFDDRMMPLEYQLEKKEEATYILLFEVPADVSDFAMVYLEEFDDGSTGDFFSVKFTV